MFFFASSEEKKLREDVKNQLEICLRSFEEKSQDKYKKSMQFISKHVQNNNQDIIEMVVDNIKATIKDDELPPVRKYQAIRLLRDLMKVQIKNKNKALGKYVLKKIFKRLTVLASHNAGSNDEEKGRDIFKNVKRDQEKYSILFLNELLFAIEEWAKTWPGVSDGMKKQFNEPYKQLLTNGVKFPKQIFKAPQAQGYRGDETNRNSQSPYNSVAPKKESISKIDQRSQSQIRSSSLEQKPVQKISSTIQSESGKLDANKVKKYLNSIVPPIEQFLVILNQIETPNDPEQLTFLNEMIQAIRPVINEGNSFFAQLQEKQMQTDPTGSVILSALRYSEKASTDIKKLLKKASQFDKFKEKYLKMGNDLVSSIKKILNPPKEEKPTTIEKPKPNQKVESAVPKITEVQKSQQPSSKKLSVPRVSSQNPYNSISGPGNNWVIKQKSQYNSNSHRDENEHQQKFGSFGIGGIGQKVKTEANKSKEKSSFANKSQTQRPSQKNVQPSQNEVESKKPKTLKEIRSNNEIPEKIEAQKNQSNTFGSFKVSDQNSKPQQQEKGVKGKKSKKEEVKDDFNDSDFKENLKVERQIQQKLPNEMNESGGFFGDFDQANPNVQLPKGRNERRFRTNNLTAKEINQNTQNPFENPFDSKIGSDSNNFSAFNHEKPSAFGSQSQVQQEKQTSLVKGQPESKRKESFNDPFQNNSFELNKSGMSKNQRNSNDDKMPNFWENDAEKSNSDNKSQTNRSQVQNPFQTQQFTKRNQKSVNPFDEENKSEVSQKNKSSVLNFEMNRSFTKSDRQNPFDNPFETTSNNLSRTNQQVTNPFEETSKDDFKPKPVEKFQSVSQQGSFKKVDIKKAKISKNSEIHNPFETMTQHKSIDEAVNQQKMNQSFKFSVRGNDQNQGFDFDQFRDVSKAQRESINTSSFANPKVKTEPNDFSNSGVFGNKKNSIQKVESVVEKQKSIHFSQFGEPGEDTQRSKSDERKEQSKKSINFSDFGDFNDVKAPSKYQFEEFSGFKNVQEKQKNKFDAFEVSKTSNKDFFRQTQKSEVNVKPDDAKSRHSGFSGFNMNADSKSERREKSSVDWNDFENNFEKGKGADRVKFDEDDFQGFGSELKLPKSQQCQNYTERSQEDSKTQKRFYNKEDLKLQFSEDNSKYQSPEFNQKYDSVNQGESKGILSSLRQVQEGKVSEERLSIRLEEFAPVQKRGYEWNPLGIKVERQLSRMFSCSDNELQAKRKELEAERVRYNEEKMMIQKVKEVYGEARKLYIDKVGKIDMILKQKESYKKMVMSLRESNHNKELEIFSLNEKIKEVSRLKEKILQKEKLFFEKTKSMKEIEGAGTNYRPNQNKWEMFNRNLKMMREREQGESKYQSVNSYTRTGYAQSRYY